MFDSFAEIALRLPLPGTFTYRLPPEMEETLQPGMRVLVDFNGREDEGIVHSLHRNLPEYETHLIKKQIDVEPVLTPDQIAMGEWMARYYLAGIGECLFKMFPQGKRFPKARTRKPGTPRALRELNEEQQAVYDRVAPALDGTGTPGTTASRVHLVHGITGSGKTEVYIQLILRALAAGKGAVLLVPEISLTVQLIERLRDVFGEELALLHSALRISERFGSYIALLRGEKHIAVGTRSAIFAPVRNPGLFILDEEHDGSYKEHSAPRYHARQIAFKRAEESGAVMLLGSATPAVETRYTAQKSEHGFGYHRLVKRATGAHLPEVNTVKINAPDIPIGGDLLAALDANIKRGEQTILLLNRRGYHPFLYCKSCSESLSCPNCSVTLNLHRDGRLVCHYCAYARRDDGRCDTCGEPTVKLGSGTQKLEEYIFRLFPHVRLERLDTDSAGKRDTIQECINRLLNGELDILLGTQMIAKGLDAPNVTLVGVLQADLGLNMPDFRAAERTFALLTQVAGRAGRGDLKGRVFLEVMNPEDRVIRYAAEQDYEAFYREELQAREQAWYPPFCRVIRLLFRAEEERNARSSAEDLAALLHRVLEKKSGKSTARPLMLGPAPAPIARLNNQFRYHLIIKTLQPNPVRETLRENIAAVRKLTRAGTHLEIDFDPVDLF